MCVPIVIFHKMSVSHVVGLKEKSSRLYPLGNMSFCEKKCKSHSSCSYCNILVWTKVVDRQTGIILRATLLKMWPACLTSDIYTYVLVVDLKLCQDSCRNSPISFFPPCGLIKGQRSVLSPQQDH